MEDQGNSGDSPLGVADDIFSHVDDTADDRRIALYQATTARLLNDGQFNAEIERNGHTIGMDWIAGAD